MNYELFLIINPGLEDLAAKEIEHKCPTSPLALHKGGIEVKADLDWIIKAHTLLKVPTRILMRIAEFKVRDFPKLHQKLTHFKWNQYLSHPEPRFEITAHKSRLMHTGRIEDTIKAALKEALVRQPLSLDWQKKNYPPQTFYVRLMDDVLTLSLDLTGEPLYKRGLQVIKGEAPIRETLAAALLMELFDGIQVPMVLVDPMCGSGTFLTEAVNFGTPLHLRPFAFETAPFFKGKLVRLPGTTEGFPLKEIRGFDVNEELLKKIDLPLKALDSVKTPLPISDKMVMMVNPPYGERIKIEGKRGSFLREAWKKFLTVDRPERFGWVLPSDMDDLFNEAPGYRLLKKRAFRNGGLMVTFWVWEKSA